MSSFNWSPIAGGGSGSSGANTTLSNLDSPTAINQALSFDSSNDGHINSADTLDMYVTAGVAGGSGASSLFLQTADSPTGSSAGVNISTGAATTSGNSAFVEITTGDTQTGNSGNIDLLSGHVNTSGNSGNIRLQTGIAAGTRGLIQLKNGSEGTAGQVWTSTDANGSGHWAASGGTPNQGASVNIANQSGFMQYNPVPFTSATQNYDQNGFLVNANKFTAKRTGIHMVTCQVFNNGGSSTDDITLFMMQNATTATSNSQLAFQLPALAGSATTMITVTKQFMMTAGDYIAFQLNSSSNSINFVNMTFTFTEIGVS